jgi:CheY-like chemotaxis protein
MKAWARTILCVDDQAELLHIESLLLQPRGYTVVTCTSAPEALRIFLGQQIDAVILDYKMPEMMGDALATEMKRAKPQVPILMFSGDLLAPETALGMVDAYVAKGAFSVLIARLEALLMRPPSPPRPKPWVRAS